jgi:hypothetical protein
VPDVKKQALLPRGEENGLASIAADLAKDPKRYRAVIGIVDCKRGGIDYDTNQEDLTVRFRRIEVVLRGDLGAAEQLIRRALEFRSEQPTLPLELEDELEATFKEMQIDPEHPGEDPDEGGKGKKGGPGESA